MFYSPRVVIIHSQIPIHDHDSNHTRGPIWTNTIPCKLAYKAHSNITLYAIWKCNARHSNALSCKLIPSSPSSLIISQSSLATFIMKLYHIIIDISNNNSHVELLFWITLNHAQIRVIIQTTIQPQFQFLLKIDWLHILISIMHISQVSIPNEVKF